tara:strand:- start:8917 stop:10029 length:1113 start_codon:yes stop_codon:yes gene_type:complete
MKVVILSEINWSFLRQRHHFITEDFAKHHDVVFVERIVSRELSFKNLKSFLLNKLRSSKKIKVQIQSRPNIKFVKSFYIPSNSILATILNRLWYKLFLEKYVKDAFVYSFTPMIDLVQGYHCLCFDIIHNWWDMKWNQKVISKRLNLYLKKADAIITDSPRINDRLAELNLQSSPRLLIPGLSKRWFDFFQIESREYKKKISSNRLVFFGNLRSNSDLSLVRRLSEIYKVDLYGVVQDNCKNFIQNCNLMGEFCQEKLMHKLLDYDAVILPYENEEFSKYISPAKYFECLSLKIPIITNSELDHLPLWNEVKVQFNKQINRAELKKNLEITNRLIENSHSEIDKVLSENIWELKIQKHNKALIDEFTKSQ